MIWRSMTTEQRAAVIKAGIAQNKTATEIGMSVGVSRKNASRVVKLFCRANGIAITMQNSGPRRPVNRPSSRWATYEDDDSIRSWLLQQDEAFAAAMALAHPELKRVSA